MKFPHFTVLKASAGSGKTYVLTRRYVRFLLADTATVPHNSLRNLLAITFSNNAAKEMKERILHLLKQLVLGDTQAVAEFTRALSLSETQLRERASEVIDEILANYSDFQVKTIDSFMTTVFKASALDFGYNPDFEILMTNETLMGYAFDLFLRRVRDGAEESRFIGQVVDRIIDNKGPMSSYPWEPTKDILEEVEAIYRKLAATGKPVCTTDYAAALEEAKCAITAKMAEIEGTVASASLEINGGSSYRGVLAAVKAGRYTDLIGKSMKAAPVRKAGAQAARAAYEQVLSEWQALTALVATYNKLYACAYYTPYLEVFDGFSSALEHVKRQEGKIFIEDVNKRLAEYLSKEMVLDVYFRLGDVIYHYLIDEFQDTSPIQWRNLFPLLENTLSQGGSLFVVGDTKQAIYGFREADYTIMSGLEESNPFPSAHHNVEELHVNYRSNGAITTFVRDLFQESLPEFEEYREAAGESGLLSYQQAARPDKKGTGFVHTCVLERNDDDPAEKGRLQELVVGIVGRGYRYSDIAVLAPRNNDVVKVTTWLNDVEIPFLSYSSLDVRKRRITGEIISLLNFLDSPLDDLAFATFILGDVFKTTCAGQEGADRSEALHNLCFTNRRNLQGRPLYKAFQEEMAGLWDIYFDRLFRLSGYLPLYDLIAEVYRTFSVYERFGTTEEAALTKILEVVKELEKEGGGNLRSLLHVALSSDVGEANWNIDVPQGINAVKVMTVHKAKGLGFPVVVLLLYGEGRKGFKYIVEDDGEGVSLLRLTKRMSEIDDELARPYNREELKDKVNKLNSLYVAFTRAGSELYVIGVKREKEAFPFLLFPNSMSHEVGQGCEVFVKSPEEILTVEALHHALPTHLISGADESVRFEEKRRGELTHRILSLIEYVGDDGADGSGEVLDEIIAKVAAETGATDEVKALKKVIEEFVEEPAPADLFQRRPERQVFREQELVDREGRLFRVDRLMIDPNLVTVVEYKTGSDKEHEDKYLNQMRNYLRIAGELYPGRVVEGMIVYVDLKKVTRVKAAKISGAYIGSSFR